MRQPLKRHEVNIMRSATTLDSRGQASGSPVTVVSSVPCSIEQLNGRELERARQLMADASLRVRFFYDASWSLTTKDWLERTTDSSKIHIGHIQDPDETDLEVTLTCAEER